MKQQQMLTSEGKETRFQMNFALALAGISQLCIALYCAEFLFLPAPPSKLNTFKPLKVYLTIVVADRIL